MTQPIALRLLARFAPLLLVVVPLLAPAVRADVVVLVPPHAEAGIPEESIDRSLEALGRAVRVEGFDVVSAGQAAAVAETDEKGTDLHADRCVTVECALEFVRLFDASFAVQTSLFREGKKASSVTVVVVEKADAYFSGSSEIQGGDIETAVTSAYKRARAKQAEGVGPWLSVGGQPRGASVYIDGQEFGQLPIHRRRIAKGMHRVVVRSDGYTTHNDSIDIPDRIDHEEKLNVTLTSLDARSGRAHVWGGSVLMGAGLALAGTSLALTFVGKGECELRAPEGACVEKLEPDYMRVGIWAGGGALLAVGGLTWLVVGQRREKPKATAHVVYGVGPASVHLRGRF